MSETNSRRALAQPFALLFVLAIAAFVLAAVTQPAYADDFDEEQDGVRPDLQVRLGAEATDKRN